MIIKDWKKFQHFKDRRPPWIKLYRDILDDPDWHDLSGDDAKVLVMFWLYASEDETLEGRLPSIKKLAFRLRTTEEELITVIHRLKDWLIVDDIKEISEGYQADTPERETYKKEGETQQQKSTPSGGFKIPDQDKIKKGSDKLIIQTIDDLCQELYTKKIFPSVHSFKNKLLKQKMNPRAILHTLARCYHKGISPEGFEGNSPWGYCIKIMSVENGNYNESDYNRTS